VMYISKRKMKVLSIINLIIGNSSFQRFYIMLHRMMFSIKQVQVLFKV
jgi:hypothetical protein